MKTKNLLNFYQTYRLYIFPVVVALSGIFLILFAIYPQTIRLINNQKTAGDLSAKLKFLDSKVSALEGYNDEDLSRKVEIALSALPADKNYPEILGLLAQLVTGSGFSLNAISLGNSGNKLGNSDTFTVKIEIKGSKILLPNLLNNLESSPRLIRIDSIDVSSGDALKVADVSLSLQVLYAPAPQNFGKEDSPLPQLTQKDEELLMSLTRNSVSVPKSERESSKGKANPFE